jgi:undecaprenyl pyrophosphate phosphatase UppP
VIKLKWNLNILFFNVKFFLFWYDEVIDYSFLKNVGNSMDAIGIIIFFQIVLESFPISSSGNVFLIQQYFGIMPGPLKFFDEFLHIPTVFVLFFFFKRQWIVLLKRFSLTYKIILKLFGYVFVTNCVTLAMWFLMKACKQYAWFANLYVLLFGFLITAIFLFYLLIYDFFMVNRCDYQKLTLKKVFILGCVQAVSMFPGISRFAATYAMARFLKLRPRRAFEFIFLMQFALLVPASVGGMYDVVYSHMFYRFLNWEVLFLVFVAMVCAYFGLRFMQRLAYSRRLGLMFFYMFIPIIMLVMLSF